jgi:hypothetical protein
MASAPTHDLADVRLFLVEELPYAWLNAYIATNPHQHNVQRITVEGFEYLWDFSTSLVKRGLIPASQAVEDRLVAAHGESRPNTRNRQNSRLRGRPNGPVDLIDQARRSPYDRGHAIAHGLGGILDLGIIPQIRSVNRGGEWRRMERYCQERPGTYCFCRPLYAGLSPHPAEIEFGILKTDATLWVQRFRNYGELDELEKIERLFQQKITDEA